MKRPEEIRIEVLVSTACSHIETRDKLAADWSCRPAGAGR